MAKLFTHDCDNCTYVKTTPRGDWYVCLNDQGRGSILCRFGAGDSEYESCPITMLANVLSGPGDLFFAEARVIALEYSKPEPVPDPPAPTELRFILPMSDSELLETFKRTCDLPFEVWSRIAVRAIQEAGLKVPTDAAN